MADQFDEMIAEAADIVRGEIRRLKKASEMRALTHGRDGEITSLLNALNQLRQLERDRQKVFDPRRLAGLDDGQLAEAIRDLVGSCKSCGADFTVPGMVS